MIHIGKISLVTILMLVGSITTEAQNDHLYRIDDCMYLYIENLTYSIILKEPETAELFSWHGNLDVAGINNSICDKNNPTLIINAKNNNHIPEMYMNFTIKRLKESWEITRFEANITKNTYSSLKLDNYTLAPSNFWASFPVDESFSCGSLELQSIGDNYPRLSFKLKSFQIQPFQYTGNTIFAPSYDCSVWLTLPMISGFILILFMTFVVLMLIYLMIELGEQTRDLKFSKQGGMLMNQSQLEATKG